MPDSPQDPKRGIQVTMMLADYVDARNGSLTIVGGGANVTGPNAPHWVALSFLVPPHLADEQHTFQLELIDLDGNGVTARGQQQPIVLGGQFEVQRDPSVPENWTLPFSAGINLGALGLPPRESVMTAVTVFS